MQRVEPVPDPAMLIEVTQALRQPSVEVLDATRAALAARGAPYEMLAALEGEGLRRQGAARRAAVLLDRAIADCPALLAAFHCAALAHIAAGEPGRARSIWLDLLQRDVDDPIARYQIGVTFQDAGELAEAARWYEAQARRRPEFLPAWHNLGVTALALQDPARAAAALATVTTADPKHRRAWIALGKARRGLGDVTGAIEAWRRAAALPPRDAEPLALAAAASAERLALVDAVDFLDQALALAPDDSALHWARGSHLSSLGEHAAAVAEFRAALEQRPPDWRADSHVLLELHYDDALASPEDLAQAHRAWSARHLGAGIHRPALPRQPRSAAPLRVGYVSPRFGAGPLASLFLPVLRAHDRSRVHATLYAAWTHDDPLAADMRTAADAWRELPADDAAAADMIAADGIDVLIDLAGHAPGHRLHVFAARPAPVQASWLDYFDTTGVEAIDYLLSDARHTPPGDAARFCERLVLLPDCRFVYAPVVPPRPSPAPVTRNGFVTFGCFNRHAKITARVLAAWKAILLRVPAARLQLRASVYGDAATVDWLRARWRSSGLPVERIDFLPFMPLEDAIRGYDTIDIALDTAPYNGGVTTCDALMAGVPVVTCDGDRMIARQGAALLSAAGRPEWVAPTLDAYVEIAVELARPDRLPGLRAGLQRAMPSSPLLDVPGFTATFERTLRLLATLGPRQAAPAQPLVITS